MSTTWYSDTGHWQDLPDKPRRALQVTWEHLAGAAVKIESISHLQNELFLYERRLRVLLNYLSSIEDTQGMLKKPMNWRSCHEIRILRAP